MEFQMVDPSSGNKEVEVIRIEKMVQGLKRGSH